jgi:hypothetical protein
LAKKELLEIDDMLKLDNNNKLNYFKI